MDKTPILTPQERRAIARILTLEQRKRIRDKITKLFADYWRSQFKLVRGGKRASDSR